MAEAQIDEKGVVYPYADTSVGAHHREIRQILSTVPRESGLRITLNAMGYSFSPPTESVPAETTRDQLIQLARSRQHLFASSGVPSQEESDTLAQIGAKMMENPHVGGIGITGRTLSATEKAIPTIIDALDTTRGKVVFIAGGFSWEPVAHVVQRYKKGELKEPPVIGDLFDYRFLHADIQAIKSAFDDKTRNPFNAPFPFTRELYMLQAAVNAADEGALVLARPYRFGTKGELPKELLGADVAVSLMGPPTHTIPEQLQMLKKGASLYTVTDMPFTVEDDFSVDTLNTNRTAWKITKNS